MTRRVVGAQTRLLRRGEKITADWLNQVAAQADANAKKLDAIRTQEPVGQDGDGTNPGVTWTEVAGTAVFGDPIRIEDASDPTIYVEIRNKIQVTMTDSDGNTYVLNFEDTAQP